MRSNPGVQGFRRKSPSRRNAFRGTSSYGRISRPPTHVPTQQMRLASRALLLRGSPLRRAKSAYFPTSSEPRMAPTPQRVAAPRVTLNSQSATRVLPTTAAARESICNGENRPAIISRPTEIGTPPASLRSAAAPFGTTPSSIIKPVESPSRRKRTQPPAGRGPRRSMPSAAPRSVAALAAIEKASSARSTASEARHET